MTVIKKTRKNKCWQVYRERGTLEYCWWECKQVQALENSMVVPLKIKNRTIV